MDKKRQRRDVILPEGQVGVRPLGGGKGVAFASMVEGAVTFVVVCGGEVVGVATSRLFDELCRLLANDASLGDSSCLRVG